MKKQYWIIALILLLAVTAGCQYAPQTPNSTSSTTGALATTRPTLPDIEPTPPMTQPAAPATQPTAPATQPIAPTTQSTAPATQPTAPATQPTLPPREKVPDFVAYDASGNPVQLSDYFGKPIILNFWASWCPPCKAELPDFQEKYLEYGDEIQFLMVNLDGGSLQEANALLQSGGYTFPVLYDLHGWAGYAFEIYYIPDTYFIDANGGLVERVNQMITADHFLR